MRVALNMLLDGIVCTIVYWDQRLEDHSIKLCQNVKQIYVTFGIIVRFPPPTIKIS